MTTISDLLANDPDQGNKDTGNNDGELLFIGEGKKYATEQDADKAIAFKDSHIQKIEEENRNLREATAKAATLEEVLQSIKKQPSSDDVTNTTVTNNPEDQTVDIDALVASALDEKLELSKKQQQEEANSKEVFSELVKRFGTRAHDVYKSKSAELGINLDELSAQSPKAVLEYFKVSSTSNTDSGYESSTINTANLTSRNPDEYGTYDYWRKQMSEGKLSREEAFRKQHESLQQMGPAKFYGQSN